MIKQNGQPRNCVKPPSLKRMSDMEYAAYCEVFRTIESDYHALCLIGDKLREVETASNRLGPLDARSDGLHAEAAPHASDRSPWEVCSSLMKLNHNEVVLCKRIAEHGMEYAVIDQSPVASAYAKATGPADILRTGDNPRQVLRDFLRSEHETLQLMVNDITANVRLVIAEKFPKQDLRRVVDEIARMCKNVARVGFIETPLDIAGQNQKPARGVRV